MAALLDRVGCPADLRRLPAGALPALAAEIRELLISSVRRTGGHLGANLGVVELTIALHRVFDSPRDAIVWDTGHQAYVHKMLTGRRGEFDGLRQSGGLSGYPRRAESVHDLVENSHASTALSYADGLAKAFALREQSDRAVVAVVGDGALTGGMCWEALNSIAVAPHRPVVIVLNDNGRSYAPTVGVVGAHLSALRAGAAGGSLFELLGLHYVGPVDGHDTAATEAALRRARALGRPVVVHCVTRKGYGYPPAEADEADRMHAVGPAAGKLRSEERSDEGGARRPPGAFGERSERGQQSPGAGRVPSEERSDEDGRSRQPGPKRAERANQQSPAPAPAPALGPGQPSRPSWTDVFGRELVAIGRERPDVVAVTAAMLRPTGLRAFATEFPDRVHDVGIAEQHAVTSAAGLAMGGLHPVVCVYSTFLNRAFDQVLLDVALHRLPVTFVLDRAGVTGSDGASHNGMWDLSLLGVVPGMRVAAPRDGERLRALLREAVDDADGPTAVRFPKAEAGAEIPAIGRIGSADLLRDDPDPDVLIVAVGPLAVAALDAAGELASAGVGARVVDPRWIQPVDPALALAAGRHRLAVTVEDNGLAGGFGDAFARAVRATGAGGHTAALALAQEFLPHGERRELLTAHRLDGAGIAAAILARLGTEAVVRERPPTHPTPVR